MHQVKKIRQLFLTDFGIAFLITLAWEAILLFVGYMFSLQAHSSAGFLDHTIQWDANWYMSIVQGHYATIHASAAFYPLFPFVVYCVSLGGHIDYALAGQIVNTLAVWFALVAAIKIGRHILGKEKRFWIVALILSAPTAFFLHAFYSEALFIAISFWAYYFALQRKWFAVGITLAFLTAARLPSVLIIALCALEFARVYKWDIKKLLNRNLLWFLIAPLGFIVFGTYLYFTQTDFLGMIHAYKATSDWSYQVFNPDIFETIAKASYQIIRFIAGLRPLNLDFIISIILPILSLASLAISSFYLILKKKNKQLPLGIVGLLSIIMFTLNSNVVSIHRYVLPALTIYVAIGLFIHGRHKRIALIIVCAVGIAVQIALYSLFATGTFVG